MNKSPNSLGVNSSFSNSSLSPSHPKFGKNNSLLNQDRNILLFDSTNYRFFGIDYKHFTNIILLGAASPHAVKKLLALSEQGKTRPKTSSTPVSNTTSIQQANGSTCSPMVIRKGHGGGNPGTANHATAHHAIPSSSNGGQTSTMGDRSDTVTLPVDLTAESSSVSSLSRKIQNTGNFYFLIDESLV